MTQATAAVSPADLPADLARGGQEPFRVHRFVLEVMGTVASLHIRAASSASRPQIEQAAQQAFALLARADGVFSSYRPESDLMRHRRGELALEDADPWMAEVMTLSAEAVEATGGLFTTDLVGPDGSCGWDPTGIVKGWAADRAAEVLRAVPGVVFCLNIGGDLIAGRGAGPIPAEIPLSWRVGVADPAAPGRVSAVVTVEEGAMATSGTAERGRHIIDPRTGAAAETELTSVTITGPSLAWTDVWATAAFVDPAVMARAQSGYRLRHSTPFRTMEG